MAANNSHEVDQNDPKEFRVIFKFNRLAVWAVLAVLTFSWSNTFAEEMPQLTIVQSGTDPLIADLKALVIDLADEKKAWDKSLYPTLELFLAGIDPKAPLQLDILFDENAEQIYRILVPILDKQKGQKVFLSDNVELLGIDVEKDPADSNLKHLSEGYEGYLRFAHDYAFFAPKGYQNLVPKDVEDPATTIQSYLDGKYDVAGGFTNPTTGVESRRSAIEALSKEVLAGLKKKRSESAEEFELRKLISKHSFDRLARYFSEAAELKFGWITEADSGEGMLQISAIPETQLAEQFGRMGKLQTQFAGVELPETAMGTGRIVVPVGPFYTQQMKEFYELSLPLALEKIESSDQKPEQKTASKKATELLYEVLEDSLEAGILDAVYRDEAAGDFQKVVIGVQARSTSKISEMLDQVALLDSRVTVKKDHETLGDVTIHQVKVDGIDAPFFTSFFGEGPLEISVGLSETVVWVGLGKDHQSLLKQMVESAQEKGESSAGSTILETRNHIAPLLKAISAQAQASPDKNHPEIATYLKLAAESFDESNDLITGTMVKKEETIHGDLQTSSGLMKFIGKAIANFAKENL